VIAGTEIMLSSEPEKGVLNPPLDERWKLPRSPLQRASLSGGAWERGVWPI